VHVAVPACRSAVHSGSQSAHQAGARRRSDCERGERVRLPCRIVRSTSAPPRCPAARAGTASQASAAGMRGCRCSIPSQCRCPDRAGRHGRDVRLGVALRRCVERAGADLEAQHARLETRAERHEAAALVAHVEAGVEVEPAGEARLGETDCRRCPWRSHRAAAASRCSHDDHVASSPTANAPARPTSCPPRRLSSTPGRAERRPSSPAARPVESHRYTDAGRRRADVAVTVERTA